MNVFPFSNEAHPRMHPPCRAKPRTNAAPPKELLNVNTSGQGRTLVHCLLDNRVPVHPYTLAAPSSWQGHSFPWLLPVRLSSNGNGGKGTEEDAAGVWAHCYTTSKQSG